MLSKCAATPAEPAHSENTSYEIMPLMNRRDFGKAALAALPAASLFAKPNSKFGGVQIGAITYCFRSLPSSAPELLKYCTTLGISSIELMGDAAENFAGAPASRGGGG